ncbi:MAG: shikimate dehydrogenase [Myxococcota bacterium]
MTAHYALFGHPISQSPSPAMHNAAFKALNIDATYELRPAKQQDLASVLAELQQNRWSGGNVTTPLKTEVAKHVRLTGEAQRAAAVNTVWHDNQQLVGALTDVDGVFVPLKEQGYAGGGDALVLGAGGAARAAVLALEALGATICIAARDANKAQGLIDILGPGVPTRALALNDALGLTQALRQAAVIVQATPVGRHNERHPFDWSVVQTTCIAFEMLYTPRMTPFLQDAERTGCATIAGSEMLLAQGAKAFSLLTDHDAPTEVMRQALKAALGSTNSLA